MVDRLVDACVRAKELTRAAAVDSAGELPRAGRALVPYFVPGSTDWGLGDVNDNLDDATSSEGSVRSLSGSDSGRENTTPSKSKSKRSAKRGKTAKVNSPQPYSSPVPVPPRVTAPSLAFAGSTIGLAAPSPEALALPSMSLLQADASRRPLSPRQPGVSHSATDALRRLLQLNSGSHSSPAAAHGPLASVV